MKRSALVLLALVLLASGCSLGAREDWAEAMRDGFEKAAAKAPSTVKQSVAVEVIETTIRQSPKPLIERSTGVVDFSKRRARLVETAKRKAEVVYDDLVVYAQRSESSIAGSKQDWARFDYEREPDVELDDNDRRLAVGAGLISPVLAVELLEGVLTGSIEQQGEGMKAGVSTTRYSGRLAPDTAVAKLDDEDRQEGAERMFATLGVQVDNFPVDVWLDADDNIRGVRYVIRQQKDRVNAFELTLSWEFPDTTPKDDTIAVPDDDATIRSDRFSEFVTELIRAFD
jgi:hypothetical protein